MPRRFAMLCIVLLTGVGHAAELPSFLQAGDVFCTRESDYDGFAARGRARTNTAVETCTTIDRPTRVAIMGGQAKVKTMVRVISGPFAYSVGWTNAALPVTR